LPKISRTLRYGLAGHLLERSTKLLFGVDWRAVMEVWNAGNIRAEG
jgi:hypothetical protein